MVTNRNSIASPAPSGSALASTFLEFASEEVVAVDESQNVVAFGGRAQR